MTATRKGADRQLAGTNNHIPHGFESEPGRKGETRQGEHATALSLTVNAPSGAFFVLELVFLPGGKTTFHWKR